MADYLDDYGNYLDDRERVAALEQAADKVLELDYEAQSCWEHTQQQENDAARLMGRILTDRAEDAFNSARNNLARQFDVPVQSVSADLIARYSNAAQVKKEVEAADPGSASHLMLSILADDAWSSYEQAYDAEFGEE